MKYIFNKKNGISIGFHALFKAESGSDKKIMLHPYSDPGFGYEQDLLVQTVDKRPLNNDMRRVFKMLEQIFAQFQVLKPNTSLTGGFPTG